MSCLCLAKESSSASSPFLGQSCIQRRKRTTVKCILDRKHINLYNTDQKSSTVIKQGERGGGGQTASTQYKKNM
jgi:hypothetical protein